MHTVFQNHIEHHTNVQADGNVELKLVIIRARKASKPLSAFKYMQESPRYSTKSERKERKMQKIVRSLLRLADQNAAFTSRQQKREKSTTFVREKLIC